MKSNYIILLFVVFTGMGCNNAGNSEMREAYMVPQLDKLIIDEQPQDDDNDIYEVKFFYDELGRVERAVSNRLFEVIQEYGYDENGTLSEISFWYQDQDSLSAGEKYLLSYTDNLLSKVERINRPLIDPTIDVEHTYQYDSNQNLNSKKSKYFIGTSNETSSEEKYEWGSGGALVNAKSFRGGELSLEFDYRSDQQRNPFRGNPYFIEQYVFHTSRNIVESSATDYIGTYDPVCLVCEVKYEYNDDGFPIEITHPWRETTVIYK